MKTFKMGDRVKIYNQKLNGVKFLEGIAVVAGVSLQGDEFYHVQFIDDGFECVRNLSEAEMA